MQAHPPPALPVFGRPSDTGVGRQETVNDTQVRLLKEFETQLQRANEYIQWQADTYQSKLTEVHEIYEAEQREWVMAELEAKNGRLLDDLRAKDSDLKRLRTAYGVLRMENWVKNVYIGDLRKECRDVTMGASELEARLKLQKERLARLDEEMADLRSSHRSEAMQISIRGSDRSRLSGASSSGPEGGRFPDEGIFSVANLGAEVNPSVQIALSDDEGRPPGAQSRHHLAVPRPAMVGERSGSHRAEALSHRTEALSHRTEALSKNRTEAHVHRTEVHVSKNRTTGCTGESAQAVSEKTSIVSGFANDDRRMHTERGLWPTHEKPSYATSHPLPTAHHKPDNVFSFTPNHAVGRALQFSPSIDLSLLTKFQAEDVALAQLQCQRPRRWVCAPPVPASPEPLVVVGGEPSPKHGVGRPRLGYLDSDPTTRSSVLKIHNNFRNSGKTSGTRAASDCFYPKFKPWYPDRSPPPWC